MSTQPDGQVSLFEAVRVMAEDDEMFGRSGACPMLLEPGNPGTRILLVTGENAGGKSLVCRFIAQHVARMAADAETKVEFMRIGMELRSAPGIHRAFIFGDEGIDSTGRNTVKSVLGALRTSAARETPHVVCLDEPDIGLSEGYQAAVGETLARYGADLPDTAVGLVVVTHSRPIASRLLELRPHCIRVGDDLRPTAEWLENGPLPRTADDLQGLCSMAANRYRAVNTIQTTRRAERDLEAAEHRKPRRR